MNPAFWTVTFALIKDTFREAAARRIFWALFGSCTALLLLLWMVGRIDVVQGATSTSVLMGNDATNPDVARMVRGTQSLIAMILYYAGMALSVFASAGLVAATFEPGRIELLLSKPVSRTHLLLGRYAGNLLVVAGNIVYLVGGSWILFGVKTGVWGAGFLLSGLCTIFVFAVLLSVIVLAGVLWDSSSVSIMATFGLMFASWILSQHAMLERLLGSESSRMVVRGLYYALPRLPEIAAIARQVIMGEPVASWWPMVTTGCFGAVVLACGVWRFQRRSF
jgi:ABC-type transport system involved in multi-copper enzyme maturation permease subunit